MKEAELTIEEQATNFVTLQHIMRVRTLLGLVVAELLARGEKHDRSKLERPEVELFTEWTPKLQGVTYGSAQYQEYLEQLKPALSHHYAKNRHHPEHWKNGVDDMNLVDLVEMFCDWKAATERHHDGNLHKSIEHNAKRFNINPQLVRILENTADLFDV
jgi:hypothetical protein